MSGAGAYREYHPKWYRRPVSTYWWLTRWPYLRFILREITSVFVAFFVILTLLQIQALRQGEAAWTALVEWLRQPLVVAANLVTLSFLLFHTITFFNLAPRAMVVRLGGRKLPDVLIAGSNYGAWLVASGLVVWLVLGD